MASGGSGTRNQQYDVWPMSVKMGVAKRYASPVAFVDMLISLQSIDFSINEQRKTALNQVKQVTETDAQRLSDSVSQTKRFPGTLQVVDLHHAAIARPLMGIRMALMFKDGKKDRGVNPNAVVPQTADYNDSQVAFMNNIDTLLADVEKGVVDQTIFETKYGLTWA